MLLHQTPKRIHVLYPCTHTHKRVNLPRGDFLSGPGAVAEPCGAVACGDRVRASAFLLGCEEGVLGVTGTTGAAATEVGGLPRLICTWGAEGGIVGGAWAWTSWGGMCWWG